MHTWNFKYYIGSVLAIPLLPLMYFQGKCIRASVPKLPEAKGPSGSFIPSEQNSRTLNMITLGESTMAGVGVDTHEEGFTGTLARELSRLNQFKTKWKVYARSGYTVKNTSHKLVPQIKEKNVDLVVIGLGGNDAFSLNTLNKWRKGIKSLIEKVRFKYPNASLVFINMPPIKEFPAFTPAIKFVIGNLVEIFGKALENEVKNHNNVFYFGNVITIKDWVTRLDTSATTQDFFSDGVHPSKLTYQTWAKDIARKITDNQIIQKVLG